MIQNKSFRRELGEFIRFFFSYIHARLTGWGNRFESIKDIVVAFLVVKRGKYSQSFLNTSFFLIIAATLIGGPIIANNNPFINDYFSESNTPGSASVIATDLSAISFDTTISKKPRDKIIEHTVTGGQTLASISSTYGISVDTIKWANNLTSDTIKPGQKLKILPISGVAHQVKSGETIYSIAKRYGVDPQNIVNFIFNEFEDLDTFALQTGQILYVPDGTPPQQKPAVRPGFARSNVAAGQPGSGRFIWPTTGTITQYPVYYHMALDIANRSLPPVIAADGGTVVFAGCVGYGYGCHIIIDHANGYKTLYGHLSKIYVSVGSGVSQGQQIGQVGSTGRSTGPHLHFEVRQGSTLLNPLSFLQ